LLYNYKNCFLSNKQNNVIQIILRKKKNKHKEDKRKMVVERVEEWVYERESSGTGGDEGRREASLRK